MRLNPCRANPLKRHNEKPLQNKASKAQPTKATNANNDKSATITFTLPLRLEMSIHRLPSTKLYNLSY
jgi:hypothetical protein